MRIFRRFAGVHSVPSLPCVRVCCLLLLIVLLSACATFRPVPAEQVPFRGRAETKRDGAVRVSAVALSAEESAAVFGVPLAEEGIQPVWFRIENDTAGKFRRLRERASSERRTARAWSELSGGLPTSGRCEES
jgi:hypothetical protein